MAVRTGSSAPREDVSKRFLIAQDGKAGEGALELQADLRHAYRELAVVVNESITDSREKSLALTALEESLMWAGKAIFKVDD